ncbi:hypothetical protein FRX31_028946 [Thalictrum thalictroides]|uniref:RING-type E3 ubiquitin transferase n=1 Tax=Thalictrum thalictroides TaxID=46969 RepID=A0A7J6V9N3_THATH|nr:hypothetical protein FRX31_028946 [Thalictrum thalictroides]
MSTAPVIRNISARMLREESISQQTTTQPAATTTHTFSPEFRPRTVALMKKNKETFLGPRVLVLESEDACAICLNDMKEGEVVRTIGCDHTFHCKCISKWVDKNTTCPLCRFDKYSSRKRKRT